MLEWHISDTLLSSVNTSKSLDKMFNYLQVRSMLKQFVMERFSVRVKYIMRQHKRE